MTVVFRRNVNVRSLECGVVSIRTEPASGAKVEEFNVESGGVYHDVLVLDVSVVHSVRDEVEHHGDDLSGDEAGVGRGEGPVPVDEVEEVDVLLVVFHNKEPVLSFRDVEHLKKGHQVRMRKG